MIPDKHPGMRDLVIQAVVVSVNYADFLEQTLPLNMAHFDQLVVVTDTRDRATRALCDKLSVPCVQTDDFYFEGDNFNKARGINIGLAHLKPGGWRMQLDADVVLPPWCRQGLRKHPLAEDTLYGADRINVHGYEAWQALRGELIGQYNYHYMVTPCGVSSPNRVGTSYGSRFVHGEWGYCPIGFFQLWHSSQSKRYPVNQGSAEHTDVTFAIQWPRAKRLLVPELFVYHLEAKDQADRANWNGRVTPPFKPPAYMID